MTRPNPFRSATTPQAKRAPAKMTDAAFADAFEADPDSPAVKAHMGTVQATMLDLSDFGDTIVEAHGELAERVYDLERALSYAQTEAAKHLGDALEGVNNNHNAAFHEREQKRAAQ